MKTIIMTTGSWYNMKTSIEITNQTHKKLHVFNVTVQNLIVIKNKNTSKHCGVAETSKFVMQTERQLSINKLLKNCGMS